MFIVEAAAIVAVLFAAMLAMQGVGRRIGERERRDEQSEGKLASGAAEGAVFGLLGLFIAFTFSGAGTRFDARRQLVVTEANAIGTAWLRIDLLPPASQPAIRDLFRQYLDARLETYQRVPDMAAVEAAFARSVALQQQIWTASVAAARSADEAPPFMVLLPSLNEMIDITTTRLMATRFHPPLPVFLTMGLLALIGAMFSGYGLADHKRPSLIHRFGFVITLTIALYLIVDLEYPRLGLIRVDAADQVLVDLRQSMR